MSKNFEELLQALQATEASTEAVLAKAQAPMTDEEMDEADDTEGDDGADDDEKIAAAAASDGACDDKKPVMAKSLQVTDENGEQHEAVDATDLIKSLIERADKHDDMLAKALTTMNGVVAKQGELIKSLTEKVATLSSQGRGRKTVLSVVEKPEAGTLAKSDTPADGGVTPEMFFAKANAAFDAGRISGKELTVIDVCRRSNAAIDPALMSKVLSA